MRIHRDDIRPTPEQEDTDDDETDPPEQFDLADFTHFAGVSRHTPEVPIAAQWDVAEEPQPSTSAPAAAPRTPPDTNSETSSVTDDTSEDSITDPTEDTAESTSGRPPSEIELSFVIPIDTKELSTHLNVI